jgi:hypothetical protein
MVKERFSFWRHRERKDKRYDPRRYLTRNQKEVARRIFEGEVTMVTSASWAFFEPFLVFLNEVGFFEVIHIGGQVLPQDEWMWHC